jgi:anaerobic nitric oxide reductase flavorubredoxin
MLPIQIRPGIHWIGMNDRSTELFEGIWPIREKGISYNSYLIDDEKKALVDLSTEGLSGALISQIQSFFAVSELDFIIVNHIEPDHSGALQHLLRIAPQAVVLGTQKTREMLKNFYGITENVRVVGDGETLSLGQHQLRFIAAPFVHWPETMMTLETTENILFSCDGFGGYGALPGTIFDDEIANLESYETEAVRYFVNIISTFCKPVRNAIAKVGGFPIAIIAPSHGLIWRKDPQRIIRLYQKLVDYATGPADLGITLIYSSMYGNTERMMEVIAQGIADEKVPLSIFNATYNHPSYIMPALWSQLGVVIGSPTYEGGLFPGLAPILKLASAKHIQNKVAARFGSFAWSSGVQREFESFAAEVKWELAGKLDFSGAPSAGDLVQGRNFGAEFARTIKERYAAQTSTGAS